MLQVSLFVSEEADEELRLGAIVDEEASGSSETTPSEGLEECLQLSDDKVFEGIVVDKVKETVEENMLSGNKPCQAAARSDGVDSTDAGQHNQGLKWFQGKRIDTELCFSNLVFVTPEEGDEDTLKEFREVMQGEVQAGQLVKISTSEVLSATKDPPEWRVHQKTDLYSENLGNINTKLENSGHA